MHSFTIGNIIRQGSDFYRLELRVDGFLSKRLLPGIIARVILIKSQ